MPSSGFDSVIVVSDVWNIYEYVSGSFTNVAGSITGTTDPRPFTFSSLADVTYINRPDRVPVYKGPLMANFADLPNWPSNHRANALRPFRRLPACIRHDRGHDQFSKQGAFSNLVDANSVPDSWDETDTTKSAGFNDLVQMQTPIVDGLELGTNFVIYSSSEAILMEFVGGTFVLTSVKNYSETRASSIRTVWSKLMASTLCSVITRFMSQTARHAGQYQMNA